MLIDRDQVRKVAHLARLELTEAEEEQFTSQLSSILEYFQQLSELDTDTVEPTTRAIDVSNVTRIDQLQPYPERELIMENAPEREDSMQGEFFKVPQIMGGE